MSAATSSIRACPCGPMPSPGGRVLFFDHTPLYVYFVALMTAIGGPTGLLLRSTTLVFGVLTVLLVFLIGLELRGVGAALVGSMLVAVNPFFVTYSWFVRMEVPMCCFMVLAIYLLIHERLFVAALAIATAVMLKEIALAFWLVAVLYVLVRRGVRAAAVVAWPTPVVFGAWLLYANEIGHVQLMSDDRTLGRIGGGRPDPGPSPPRRYPGVGEPRPREGHRTGDDLRRWCHGGARRDPARSGPADRARPHRLRHGRHRRVVRHPPQGAAIRRRDRADDRAVGRSPRRLARGLGRDPGNGPRPGDGDGVGTAADRAGRFRATLRRRSDSAHELPPHPKPASASRPRDDPKEPSTPWVYPSDASRMPGRASGVPTSRSASRRSRSARTATR